MLSMLDGARLAAGIVFASPLLRTRPLFTPVSLHKVCTPCADGLCSSKVTTLGVGFDMGNIPRALGWALGFKGPGDQALIPTSFT